MQTIAGQRGTVPAALSWAAWGMLLPWAGGWQGPILPAPCLMLRGVCPTLQLPGSYLHPRAGLSPVGCGLGPGLCSVELAGSRSQLGHQLFPEPPTARALGGDGG